MGKTTESRHIIRLTQLKLVLQIQQDPHFHDRLLSWLNDKKHIINFLCTTEAIKRLQIFLRNQLKKEVEILETYFTLDNTISTEDKNLCDMRLIKLLDIIRLLYKNDDFYQEDDKNIPFCNRLMIITDNFKVKTNLIALLMNTSFQKTEKDFFYHIYFLCDHIDIHDLRDCGIKKIYQLGISLKEFRFFFVLENQEKSIVIEDFYKFVWENQLADKHYRKVTDFILSNFAIVLEPNSMIHLALLSKVKLYFKAVKFNSDGTVINDANQIVQAIAYANAMYCYIEYFVLGQEVTEHISIPNIFSFPPAYSEIFKELLEVFLLESSDKETHLTIMKAINEILEIQEKTSAVDIVGRLNDNSSLIYKYLSAAKQYLSNQNPSLFAPSRKEKINLEAVSSNEFMLELFKIMTVQIQQTHELNPVACGIIEKIFRKEAICPYNDEVIAEAGNLLVIVDYEEEKIVKAIIEKVQKQPESSKPYLRVLNDFFSKKTIHRIIQRRDLTYVARQSSESQILVKMQEVIKKEIETSTSITRDSYLSETIQLISNICEQSPTLLDTIQKTSPILLPFLFQIISSAEHIPADIQSITDVINFMHHVSLIEGPVRNTMLKRPMVSFITKILIMDKFSQPLTRNVKTIGGYIVGSLSRFLSNIKIVGQYILNAFISAAILLNEEYKQCTLLDFLEKVDTSVQRFEKLRVKIDQQIIIKILRCDSKLINLLKIIERTNAMIFQKFTSKSLYMFLKPLLEIALQRDNVFLDGSLQHNILRNAIDSTIRSIKNFNTKMEKKDQVALENNVEVLQRIQQNSAEEDENQENSPSEAQRLNERLITENSEQLSESQHNQQHVSNPIVIIESENNDGDNQPQQEPQNPEQDQNSDDEGRILFDQLISQSSIDSDKEDIVELEEVYQENKDKIIEKKSDKNEKMDEEKKRDSFGEVKAFFRQLTWRATKELVEKYETLPEQVVTKLYECYENLDRLILPVMENTSNQGEKLREKITRQISENSIMDEVQRQTIELSKTKNNSTVFTFNLLNLQITLYSSKLERIIKLMYSTLNFENPEFNFPEYETVIEKYSNYLTFYLEIVSETNARNISTFIQNEELKFLETSKLPKTRIENKTMDVENFKKSLQIELNDKSTLFNLLFDSFIKLVSGSLSQNNREFLKKPQGLRYFKFVNDTLLEKVRSYLVAKILPIIKNDNISVREVQKYRQSMKVIMEILLPSEGKSGQKFKTNTNLLITLYIHSYGFDKENLIELLARLVVEQEEANREQEDLVFEDTPTNRWRYLRKFFCKMIFFKIKHFLSQGFQQQIEPIEIEQNNPDHQNYQKQMKKNFFVYSRIHRLICTFLERAFFAKNKNSYIRDILLFTASQFSNYCNRITKTKDSIYYNYVFEDNLGKQMTEEEFYAEVNERNGELLEKITESMDKSVFHYVPMVLKAIFQVERPGDNRLMAKFNEKIKQRFFQISRRINETYESLTGCNLDLGFSIPKKRSSLGQISFFLPRITQRIEEEHEEPELDLKECVLKLNNLFAFVIEFIKFFKANQYFEQGYPKITVNYIKSIVEFGTFLLSNFQVEKHFPQQGDQMVSAIIRMVEEFCFYKQAKEDFIKSRRTLRLKEKHAQKKKMYRNKKLKKFNKDLDSDSKSNYTNQLEDFSVSQSLPAKPSKKEKTRTKGEKKAKKVSKKQKSAKRQKPSESTPKPKERKNTTKQQNTMLQIQHQRSILNRTVTDFIKISLTASHEKPYLYARTVHLIINFLEKFSRDVVFRTESDINNMKSGKQFKKYKNKFFVLGSEVFGDLIKVKLKNQKLQGFFYLINYLGMKLMTEPHVKVDFECAIKRFFYEKEQKAETMPFSSYTKDKYRIRISQFQDYMIEDKLRDLPDLSYLLTIVEEKKKSDDQIKETSFKKKKEESYSEHYHEFTKKNYKRFSELSDNSSIYIKLKNSQELDVISLPSIKRKKLSHVQQDEQKKVRFYEYHPEGDFAALICQIINHIVKIVVKEIVEILDGVKMQNEEEKEKEVLKAFNLKTLLYSLQVLSRQSPTIVPWIARFKCKKILVNEIKAYGLTQQSEAYKKIISYVYGTTELAVQQFTEVSFLTLLIKFIYPVSQISTFLFELCLDNNVLLQDKSQKPKENKQLTEPQQSKKWITFGSLIRQKIVSEIQGQLNINKAFDEDFIRSGFNQSKNSSLVVKKVSCMGLLTILLSIKEFAKLCIESGIMRKLQEEYKRTSAITRAQCHSNSETQLSLTSSIMRNFLINYFLRPIEILQELSIQYHITKKQSQHRFLQQFTNTNRVHIRFLLTSQTINDQLFSNDVFFKSKFKTEWFYANNLEGDEAVEYDDEMDERMESVDGSENGMDEMFDDEDSSEDEGRPLDEEIESQGVLSMSGVDMLEDNQQEDDLGEEDNRHWYGSQQDPFDRDSNTFENFVLYPGEDQVLEDGDDLEDDQDDDEQSVDVSDDDLDQDNLIDSYDDSEDEDDGIEIEMSPSDANLLFPIDENSGQAHPFWSFGSDASMTVVSTHIVPQVGIYHYFIPYEPEARDHPNHVCNNPTKPEIKQLENLYEIFMDVVSFENITITDSMVKLENQQAKLIRKLFKIAVYKKVKGLKSVENELILKLEEEYYDQLYKIFTLDSMFLVSEKIDFRDCDKTAYYLQSLPIHYIDMYMDESEVYFNEITKPLRGRRRGMFFSPQMERIRRPENYRNMMSRIRQIQHLHRPGEMRDAFLASDSSSDNDGINQEQNPEEPEGIEAEGEQNGVINRIQFNIQNPNGGDVNFHTDLNQILANIGMSEREFMNLPSDVQSDIIQNSLQSQLQHVEGPLNQLIDRFGGERNDGLEAPNVSPAMQPHPQQEIEEEQSEIEMPESFEMEEENQRNQEHEDEAMEEDQQEQEEDTPINEINNENENEIAEVQVLPERYRKISLEHSQKISRDIIETLNKDHKNDSKFPQISQDLLEEIIESIFVLQCKDFCRFPYSFLSLNMINSKSCSKIISSLVTLLNLTPESSDLDIMIENRQCGEACIQARKTPNDLIPKLSLRTYLYEISKDYKNEIYPNISIKILHILESLTKNYSISMQMLKVNNSPAKSLEKYVLTGSREEIFLSSFEALIRLLHSSTVRQSPVMVQQILRITNNVVSHYFEKNIFFIHQQQKQLKGSRKNIPQIVQNTQNKIDAENQGELNILPVSLQPKEQTISSIEIHKAIELSDYSIQLLCSLLMSDELRQSQNLSELIMKLSINGKNLILFIKNIETVLEKLCQRSIIFLSKEKKQMEQDGNQRSLHGSQVEEIEIEDLMKVFCLLEIFSSMIKQFKQFAYRHHIDRYDFIMGKFRNIIESKSLYSLCETIASIISTTGQGNDLIRNIPEIFEIFFVVFSINIELESKNGEEDKNVLEEKNANKIASLGDINEKHKLNSAMNSQNQPSSDVFLIQNVAFNKLWNEKMCSPNGRLLLNSTIKRKLSTILKRKKQLQSMSLFDLPMIKIIMNSPHLLDFQNKRALFRAEMKRLKRRKSQDRVIYVSLDRKEVFQQSYNLIMDKKPEELKNRVKIDFEGEEGEDAGGLTREWYQLLSTEMFNPNYGLFKPSSTGNTYQPSSMSYVNSQHLNYFKFIGRIMGKALFDGYMLDAYFTPAFYKHILKIPITYLDMEEEDYEYFNSLKWILNNSPIEDYMELDFTYEFDNFGEIKTKELIPNGEKVKVNQENKWRYVQLICYAKMATAVQSQLQMFLQGLHQIVPHKYLKIFDPKELEMMISGLPTIDIADLRRNTELVNYQKTDQIILWLFEVLESFDMSLRTAFLQFVTGTSKVPPEGFKGLNGYNGPQKFTIQKEFDVKKLPRAHTCFNQLDLPPYATKEILIEKLTYAITEGKEGFGIA